MLVLDIAMENMDVGYTVERQTNILGHDPLLLSCPLCKNCPMVKGFFSLNFELII